MRWPIFSTARRNAGIHCAACSRKEAGFELAELAKSSNAGHLRRRHAAGHGRIRRRWPEAFARRIEVLGRPRDPANPITLTNSTTPNQRSCCSLPRRPGPKRFGQRFAANSTPTKHRWSIRTPSPGRRSARLFDSECSAARSVVLTSWRLLLDDLDAAAGNSGTIASDLVQLRGLAVRQDETSFPAGSRRVNWGPNSDGDLRAIASWPTT